VVRQLLLVLIKYS